MKQQNYSAIQENYGLEKKEKANKITNEKPTREPTLSEEYRRWRGELGARSCSRNREKQDAALFSPCLSKGTRAEGTGVRERKKGVRGGGGGACGVHKRGLCARGARGEKACRRREETAERGGGAGCAERWGPASDRDEHGIRPLFTVWKAKGYRPFVDGPMWVWALGLGWAQRPFFHPFF